MMTFRCVLCGDPLLATEQWVALNPQQHAHRCCSLRSVVGGIGHQIAHDYWCTIRHDPDAGFTYRQSAEMVAALADVIGIDAVARRATV